ncbi:3-deoxy-D-manno-octulosonic acid kinase [Modicisalibacter muralis]|uniref:3-deoxy-D-manno-octulosonic acid kinase n=1 Tax=Modicisalibacter muralis TaxID=119000 RepID=A0A1G9KXQ9_9GAMM|nr:3-deoxy-D-manno-octulosonic acid kinase [Halomonas muralis]SDL54492.1 3-deoxy-D-manno-octulosonic acid kinase [Halomonas muralis]
MRLATFQMGKDFILTDDGILRGPVGTPQMAPAGQHPVSPIPAWFTPAFWRDHDAVTGEAPGRGASLFVDPSLLGIGGQQWVLRPYRRGGMAARLSESRYVWTGLARTRGFRELRLTAELHARGLPVPAPVAAHVRRHGLSYAAALLTVRLPGARALAESLPRADTALLERVGATIRCFHDAGLDHVDLNARNLLVTPDERVWLIDLDRCRLRQPGRWREANLRRLERSLERFAPDQGKNLLNRVLHGYHSPTTVT